MFLKNENDYFYYQLFINIYSKAPLFKRSFVGIFTKKYPHGDNKFYFYI